MSLITVDFETEAIDNRPSYPPIPVGVAIQHGARKKYLAWGHPCENNCSKSDAVAELKKLYRSERIIFHNAAFDIEVGQKHLGLPFPKRFDDTMILAFLNDPRDDDLSLKGLASTYLDMPPEEQDRLRAWILDNVEEARRKPSTWGAYIAAAPGKLVGVYAKGDVTRTARLFKLFYPIIKEEGMSAWYEKEKQLVKTKLTMEQGGIRTDTKKLVKELPQWHAAADDIKTKIRKRLKISKAWEGDNCKDGIFNSNSGPQLSKAMDNAGVVSDWIYTDKGNKSTSRENLEAVCEDKKLLELLSLDSVLKNYVGTFLDPWTKSAIANNGYVYPSFNFVRNRNEDGKGLGTRTGRLSSSNPNLQNIPASVEESQHRDLLLLLKKFMKSYGVDFIGLRNYFIPDEGCVFIGRDYSQQELRILAHYEDGVFLQMYKTDPRMDAHDAIRQLVLELIGIGFPRKHIKVSNFGILYGMGLAALAKRIGCEKEAAKQLKKSILAAVPGINELSEELKKLAYNDQPFYTWGGRRYFCEEPKYIKGKLQTFEYKMLNLLIQGSAADCTKQAMLNCQSIKDARPVLQVHDELLMCAPKATWKKQMQFMREAMEDVNFEIPMFTDGKQSARSWALMKDCA